ncbi:hypothetical protein Tco_0058902 [Tanacetum coccineum]
MAQQQHAADVHPDELCPPNKRYDLMDANKKVDLEHFWHTLKEDGSKYRLRFMLDRKDLTLTLETSEQSFIFHKQLTTIIFPFVPPPYFLTWFPSYKTSIGIYNGVEDIIKFQDNWSSAAMTNVIQDILQMLGNTCHWMGSTAITDNANDVLLCQ